MYNPRLGRFMSEDPLYRKYPMLSSYQYASNRPIQCIDIDGLEAYFYNSGEFIKWGEDKSKTAPVILVHGSKEYNLKLNVEQFQNRVYFLSGEGASQKEALYYAYVLKNAKAYGYHGKGFTEDKMLSVLWQDNKYKKADFLAGLPGEAKTKNYQSYKAAFLLKDDFKLWDSGYKMRAAAILNAEASLSEDPTRGATNWGGGKGNYDYYVGMFGKDNVITLIDGKFRHNFYNLNTRKLNPLPKEEDKKEDKKETK